MNSKNYIFRESGALALGQLLCTGAMIGVFSLLGKYDTSVLLGGIVGALIATANYFFMALFANMAADKAEAQDIAGGQKLIQLSYMGRMAAMLIILVVCAKTEIFHLLALVIPLVFTRPILTIKELIKKKGGNQA